MPDPDLNRLRQTAPWNGSADDDAITKKKRDFSKTTEPEAGSAIQPIMRRSSSFRSTMLPACHYDFRIKCRRRAQVLGNPEGPLHRSTRETPGPAHRGPSARGGGDYCRFSRVGDPERWRIRRRDRSGLGSRHTWENHSPAREDGIVPAEKALEQGHLLMHLEGEKIAGGYALQRTRGTPVMTRNGCS